MIHTTSTLVPLLVSLPMILDYERPVRLPIPRNDKIVMVIATAALETEEPVKMAVWLDTLGAHESGYNPSLVGDHGQSCGAWQTPCGETPGFAACTAAEEQDPKKCRWGWAFHTAPTVALQQARKATAILKRALDGCPSHPIWMYARGVCGESRTAKLYEVDVDTALGVLAPYM